MQGCKSNWLTQDICEISVHPSTPSTSQPGGCTEDSQQVTTVGPKANSNHFIPVQVFGSFSGNRFLTSVWKSSPLSGVPIWSFHASVTPFSHSDVQDITHNCWGFFPFLPLKLKTILFVLTWWGSGRHSHLSTARWRMRRAAPWWSAPASIDPACSYLGMPSSPALTESKIKPHKNTSHKLLAKGCAAF